MDNRVILLKMISLIDKIENYISGMDYDSFTKNEMVVEVCAFNLSQLGEYSHKLEDDFQKNNPSIPWKAIYGMRNRIIHDYDGVNIKVVWETVTQDLSSLKEQLSIICCK